MAATRSWQPLLPRCRLARRSARPPELPRREPNRIVRRWRRAPPLSWSWRFPEKIGAVFECSRNRLLGQTGRAWGIDGDAMAAVGRTESSLGRVDLEGPRRLVRQVAAHASIRDASRAPGFGELRVPARLVALPAFRGHRHEVPLLLVDVVTGRARH